MIQQLEYVHSQLMFVLTGEHNTLLSVSTHPFLPFFVEARIHDVLHKNPNYDIQVRRSFQWSILIMYT